MIRVEETLEVPGDAAEVSAYLADPENDARWQRGIVHMALLEGSPGQPGATYERVQEIMGRKIKSTARLVAHEPGRRVRFEADGNVMKQSTEYALAPAEKGTRVTARIEGELLGFGAMFESVAGDALQKEVPASLARLRDAWAGRG